VPEDADVVYGMFLVNSISASVLFDSGASHSFITESFMEKHNCWGLVLKCYELRRRQHKMLNVNVLRPSKHYFPWDIMIFR
jgi:hypothetical protein